MPRLTFTLRDVFWLTLLVAMGVGWWVDRRRRGEQWGQIYYELRKAQSEYGVRTEWEIDSDGKLRATIREGTENRPN